MRKGANWPKTGWHLCFFRLTVLKTVGASIDNSNYAYYNPDIRSSYD